MTSSKASGEVVVGNLLSTAALRFGEREAFFCEPTGRRFTFAQTNARSNRLANALLELGLRKGDCVAFLASNRIEVVEIYFALAKAGLVGMPLNYRLAPVEIVALMKEVDAVAMLFEGRFVDTAALVHREMPQVRAQIRIGAPDGEAQLAAHDYDDLLAAASPAEPGVEVSEADPYYYNLTSGTTGLPKCYVITHYNNALIFNMFHVFEMTRHDVVMTVFPMYGRVGFAWVAASVMYGCRNVITNFAPQRVLELFASERVSILNLVATMAAMLLQCPEAKTTDLSSLRAVVFAGSLLPAPIREAVTSQLCKGLYEYYGMQETGTLVASTPEDRERRPNSVGQAILFTDVRIIDPDGNDLPAGESGAILGRSPGGVTAYYKNPEKSAETFLEGGWINTGDVGYLDEEGYLYITGRIKDIIVTGGQNVHAGEVEETILGLAGVAECAVIGLPDDLWGERVSAVIVPQSGQDIDAGVIVSWCRQSLAGFKVPRQVLFRDEPLPQTPTGKIRKFMLVEEYKETPIE